MKIPKSGVSQDVTVKRIIEGHYNDSNQWVEGGEIMIATITGASIQPKSGKERAAVSGTNYESNYTLYAGSYDITFETGYSDIQKKDTVIDSKERQYKVIYPGNWGSHYQADLKLEAVNES